MSNLLKECLSNTGAINEAEDNIRGGSVLMLDVKDFIETEIAPKYKLRSEGENLFAGGPSFANQKYRSIKDAQYVVDEIVADLTDEFGSEIVDTRVEEEDGYYTIILDFGEAEQHRSGSKGKQIKVQAGSMTRPSYSKSMKPVRRGRKGYYFVRILVSLSPEDFNA